MFQDSEENPVDMEVDDETATRKIIEKALAEAALEQKFGDCDTLEKSLTVNFVLKI